MIMTLWFYRRISLFLEDIWVKCHGVCNLLFKRFYLLIFKEREGREKERERNINWLPLVRPQPGMHKRQLCPVPGLGIEPATFWFVG